MWDGRLDQDIGQCGGGQFTFAFFERFTEKLFASQPLVSSRTTLLTPSTRP